MLNHNQIENILKYCNDDTYVKIFCALKKSILKNLFIYEGYVLTRLIPLFFRGRLIDINKKYFEFIYLDSISLCTRDTENLNLDECKKKYILNDRKICFRGCHFNAKIKMKAGEIIYDVCWGDMIINKIIKEKHICDVSFEYFNKKNINVVDSISNNHINLKNFKKLNRLDFNYLHETNKIIKNYENVKIKNIVFDKNKINLENNNLKIKSKNLIVKPKDLNEAQKIIDYKILILDFCLQPEKMITKDNYTKILKFKKDYEDYFNSDDFDRYLDYLNYFYSLELFILKINNYEYEKDYSDNIKLREKIFPFIEKIKNYPNLKKTKILLNLGNKKFYF